MQTLFILNDAPYGSERSYNAPRFSKALAQRVDAPCCLHESNRDQMRYDFLPLLAGREHEMASVRCDRQARRRSAMNVPWDGNSRNTLASSPRRRHSSHATSKQW